MQPQWPQLWVTVGQERSGEWTIEQTGSRALWTGVNTRGRYGSTGCSYYQGEEEEVIVKTKGVGGASLEINT